MDTTTTPTVTTHTKGIDPTVAALLASRGPDGIGSGCHGNDYGRGYGYNGVAEAQAVAALTTAKDSVTAINAAKDFLDSEIAHVASGMQAGFAAAGVTACTNQAATMAAVCKTEHHLSTQAERIGAANALAHCEIKNLIREVGCDVKNTVHQEGERTRALINANTLDEVRQQLSDAKAKIAVLDQTNVLVAQLKKGNGHE